MESLTLEQTYYIGELKDAAQQPGFLSYWELRQHWYDKEFQDFVQNSLFSAKDTRQLYSL